MTQFAFLLNGSPSVENSPDLPGNISHLQPNFLSTTQRHSHTIRSVHEPGNSCVMYSDLFGNSKFNIALEMCTQIKNYSQWIYLEMSHNEWLQQEKKLREESLGTFFCSFQGRRSMGDRPRVQLKIVYDNRSKTELKQTNWTMGHPMNCDIIVWLWMIHAETVFGVDAINASEAPKWSRNISINKKESRTVIGALESWTSDWRAWATVDLCHNIIDFIPLKLSLYVWPKY